MKCQSWEVTQERSSLAFSKDFDLEEYSFSGSARIAIDVLGKGIEPKSFNAARHVAPTKVAVINVSTIHAEQRFEPSM